MMSHPENYFHPKDYFPPKYFFIIDFHITLPPRSKKQTNSKSLAYAYNPNIFQYII